MLCTAAFVCYPMRNKPPSCSDLLRREATSARLRRVPRSASLCLETRWLALPSLRKAYRVADSPHPVTRSARGRFRGKPYYALQQMPPSDSSRSSTLTTFSRHTDKFGLGFSAIATSATGATHLTGRELVWRMITAAVLVFLLNRLEEYVE